MDIDDLEIFSVSDDMQPDKHYVTIQVIANKYSGILKVMEPTKEEEWKWFDLNELSENLYSPTKQFVEKYKSKK